MLKPPCEQQPGIAHRAACSWRVYLDVLLVCAPIDVRGFLVSMLGVRMLCFVVILCAGRLNMPCLTINFYSEMTYVSNYTYSPGTSGGVVVTRRGGL